MSKESFCMFCTYFSEQVKQNDATKAVLLIADGAGAHQKKVCLERGIELQHLPTACPELNPVERFFEELQKEISNTIYDTLENAQDNFCQLLKKYFLNQNQIIQLCNFPYIRTQ